MARLNEAPPPAESIDSLKRRFIRQNRELAKNNSTQSVRIRALETEQARLLAENLALREQNIQLQTELEHSKGHHAAQQISSVKDKLESKLQEIGGLVAELNAIQRPSYKNRPSTSEPSRAVEHFEWRRAMKEQAGEQDEDDVLPTIREDKFFPRRTLDAEELRAVLSGNAEDSPDLGPPPVAHFPEEDPIKFDPKPIPEEANDDMDVDQKEEDELPAANLVNLETRRKRRDSSTKLDLRKMSVFQSPQDEDHDGKGNSENEEPKPSKNARKRKLSAAEDLQLESEDKDHRDDFRYSRRASMNADRGENRHQQVEPAIKQNSKLDLFIAAERKALGDKTNALSPQKIQKSDAKPDAKKTTTSEKVTSRSRAKDRKTKASIVKIAPTDTNEVVETADVAIDEPQQPEQPELPPKTPAGLDLFSPASTEPSAARQESRDTPPPGDLNASGTADAPAGSRARRSRTQVNYAEPNLISKMRRPTKDMIDAVADSRRSVGGQPDSSKSAPNSSNALRTVVIKKERPEDVNSGWKSLPATSEQPEPHSPLINKTAAPRQAAEPMETDDKEAEQPDGKPSKSAAAMKDLMSSSTSRKRTTKTNTSDLERKDRPDLAIFDFDTNADSLPATSDNRAAIDDAADTHAEIMKSSRALAAKSSRRHSSIVSTSTASSKDSSSTSSASGSTGERPTKSVGFADESSRSRAIRDLKASRSGTSSSSASATESGRSERSAARRRSMMI